VTGLRCFYVGISLILVRFSTSLDPRRSCKKPGGRAIMPRVPLSDRAAGSSRKITVAERLQSLAQDMLSSCNRHFRVGSCEIVSSNWKSQTETGQNPDTAADDDWLATIAAEDRQQSRRSGGWGSQRPARIFPTLERQLARGPAQRGGALPWQPKLGTASVVALPLAPGTAHTTRLRGAPAAKASMLSIN
jgi:hypothetical protein